MKPIPKGAWQYAVLLFILFAIAVIAARTTLDYLADRMEDRQYEQALKGTMWAVWALTMGFMFIAGAFGLWAIQFSSEAESARRLGIFVEDMSYLRDGLVSLDRKGRIMATNPAFKLLAPGATRAHTLPDVFPCLKPDDIQALTVADVPREAERDAEVPAGVRTLRFRSQPSAGLRLILISDVTSQKAEETRRQQIARFQLVGRLARGVAHDFNNILCSIAGHASLLLRLKPGSEDTARFLQTIARESERGTVLAGHLLDLTQMGGVGKPTDRIGDHLEKAADLLRSGLPTEWELQTQISENLPPAPLSGLQIEQAVSNLGILLSDALSVPGILRISASPPGTDPLTHVPSRFGSVIMLCALNRGATSPSGEPVETTAPDDRTTAEDAGILQSVVRTMVEEVGGSFHMLRFPDGSLCCRIALPTVSQDLVDSVADEPPQELRAYLAGWTILVARAPRHPLPIERHLQAMGITVRVVDDVVSALSGLDPDHAPDAMVWIKSMLGRESEGLLRAIIKLCPAAGIVVMTDDPAAEPAALADAVVFVPIQATMARVAEALLEAKALAATRQRRA